MDRLPNWLHIPLCEGGESKQHPRKACISVIWFPNMMHSRLCCTARSGSYTEPRPIYLQSTIYYTSLDDISDLYIRKIFLILSKESCSVKWLGTFSKKTMENKGRYMGEANLEQDHHCFERLLLLELRALRLRDKFSPLPCFHSLCTTR